MQTKKTKQDPNNNNNNSVQGNIASTLVGQIEHQENHHHYPKSQGSPTSKEWFLEGSVFLVATKKQQAHIQQLYETLQKETRVLFQGALPQVPFLWRCLKPIFQKHPSIVHLSCEGTVYCEDVKGNPADLISLAGYIKTFYKEKKAWVIILSTCTKESDASELQVKNNCVIFISSQVVPPLAEIFCTTFYSTLVTGEKLGTSFKRAYFEACGGYGLKKGWILSKDKGKIANFTGSNQFHLLVFFLLIHKIPSVTRTELKPRDIPARLFKWWWKFWEGSTVIVTCGISTDIPSNVPITAVYYVQVEKNGLVKMKLGYGTSSSEFENFLNQQFTRSKESIFEKRTRLWVGQIASNIQDSLTVDVVQTWKAVHEATVIVGITSEWVTFWGTEEGFQRMITLWSESKLLKISLIQLYEGTCFSRFAILSVFFFFFFFF